jgi:hypothetical protein
MKDWQTTLFGAMAAIGQILFNATSLPPWVWTVGQCFTAVGLVGLGLYAPSKKLRDKIAPRPEPPKTP